jgi:hypothetical protein
MIFFVSLKFFPSEIFLGDLAAGRCVSLGLNRSEVYKKDGTRL